MKENLDGYAKYYQRVLDLGVNGYKTVAGGTGLGKTHGVVQCVKANKSDHKFIYVSHRHNLLEDMANNLQETGIEFCYLRNDSDTIRFILETDSGLERLTNLLEDEVFKEYIIYTKNSAKETWKYSPDNCKKHIHKAKRILTLQSKSNVDLLEALDPEDVFKRESSSILNFFKRVFFELAEINNDLNSRNPGNKYSKFDFKAEDRFEVVSRHPVIFELFPYWSFEADEKKPVLLITIQKLFSGFFNGSKNVNIYKLKNKVFFLDEFEFLEPVLLDKIIEESKLDNPFVFIAYFYHNISIKLLDPNYLSEYLTIRTQLKTIWNKIEKLKKGSSFPDIRFFGVKDSKVIQSFVGSGLYQTNYTSIDQPIYLEVDQKLQRYWLTGSHSPSSPTTFNLMKSIKLITNEILQFYLQLKVDNEKLYSELLEDAYEKTDYVAHLNRLSFFSVMPPRRKGSDKGYRISNFSYLYQRGYVLYVLDKPPTQAEPNEVHLNFYMVNSSPERCLLGLIQKNIVFGLSATATITRYLEHFNLNWIKKELDFEADESTLFMEIDEEDLSIISSLSNEKADKRNNFIELSIADKRCREPFKTIAKQLKEDSKFVSVSSIHDYHVVRLYLFFNTLDWIQLNPLTEKKREAVDSHIVFFNSLRQIRAFVESKNEFTPYFKVNSKGKHHYNISYFGRSLCIILLDSTAHKYYFDSQNRKEYNSLFSISHPTILITQYPSANNGVNLQYERKIGSNSVMEDYQTIHLLEAPHFYFSSASNRNENEIKADIWKLAQLVLAKKINPSEFNRRVKGIMNNSNDLNRIYKDSPDYTLNQVAKIIQALGRIERVRDREVGLQRGRISESVLNIFNRYFYNSEIQPIITESSPFFSKFVQLFFSQIQGFTIQKLDKNDKERPSEILREDALCQDSLSKYVNTIKHIQGGQIVDRSKARNFIDNWRELRKSALRFDFKSHWIRNCHGTFFSKKIFKNSIISWNPEDGRVHEFDKHEIHGEFLKWDFNKHFRHISKHEEVRNYFHSQGYELEFIDHCNFQFFTPSFFQQIYLGALGEEASKAIFVSQKTDDGERLFEVLETEEINLSLFEVVDYVIPKLDWYVDAKFFSDENMTVSHITQQVKLKCTKKITKIHSINKQAKLILVNAHSDYTGHVSFFDANFNLTDIKDSAIIVFPSLFHLKDFLSTH